MKITLATFVGAVLLPSALCFTVLPPPPPSRSVITAQAQVPGPKSAPLGSWRKAFQRRESSTKQQLSVQMPGAHTNAVEVRGPVAGVRRFGRNLANLASRITPDRLKPRSWGDSRVVQAAKARASAVTSYAVAASDRVADSFLDRIAHPIVSLFLEPLVLEPMEVLHRAIKRWWRRAKRSVVMVTTSAVLTIAGHAGAARAAVRPQGDRGGAKTNIVRGATKTTTNKKTKTKVQVVVKEEGPVAKLKGIVVKNPEKVGGGVVAVGGGLYLYKKRRDEEEHWAHLDDDWYYQEDEIPKARQLAKHGHLGDVTLADIDKAVSEGKVALKGRKKDPKHRRVTKSDQVIVREYKKDPTVTDSLVNLFRKNKAVTRLVREEQLAWAALDTERKDGLFILAVAKEMNRLSPVKLALPLDQHEDVDDTLITAHNTNTPTTEAVAVSGVDPAPDATAPLPLTSEDDGKSLLEITAAQAANGTETASAPTSIDTSTSDPTTTDQPTTQESSKSPSPADIAYGRIEGVLKSSELSPEDAAEAFANVVNVAVVKMVDALVPSLKAPEAETIKRVESLLTFMEQAGDLFIKVAPNVTSIVPVTYQGQAPARKLEMIYTRYCQQALLEDLEYGNAKAVRIQELFDISNKKADKIAQQIMRSQENWMKLLEKQLGPLGQLANGLEGGGDLTKMLESMGGPGGFPDMTGMGGEKELKETMDALKAVVQQGGLSDTDIEELRRVCSSQGVDLEELVKTMDAVSDSMPPENQELARMFKEALRRNS